MVDMGDLFTHDEFAIDDNNEFITLRRRYKYVKISVVIDNFIFVSNGKWETPTFLHLNSNVLESWK
jgi:hypothetical protein